MGLSCLQVVTLGLEVRALVVGDFNVVFVGAVVRYKFHLDALYGQRCHMLALRFARAKAYAWFEVIVLYALLGQCFCMVVVAGFRSLLMISSSSSKGKYILS